MSNRSWFWVELVAAVVGAGMVVVGVSMIALSVGCIVAGVIVVFAAYLARVVRLAVVSADVG